LTAWDDLTLHQHLAVFIGFSSVFIGVHRWLEILLDQEQAELMAGPTGLCALCVLCGE
jgi:hypothetical protein